MSSTAERYDKNLKQGELSYSSLHRWVATQRGKASEHTCEFADILCSNKLHWSNISGKYLQDLKDWRVLCSSHHMLEDMTDEWRENQANSAFRRWKKEKDNDFFVPRKS